MKAIYMIFGFIFLALGAVGVILPILPTTPFLIVASICFARGSKRVNEWFLSTKLYKNHLDSFVKERAMTLKSKIMILSFASTMLIIAFISMNNLYGRLFIVALIVFKYYYFIFRIKTITKPQSEVVELNNAEIE